MTRMGRLPPMDGSSGTVGPEPVKLSRIRMSRRTDLGRPWPSETPPVAEAGGPYLLGEANATNGRYTSALNGSGSSDDYGIVKYEWDLGDGLSDNFNDGVADGWTVDAGTWNVTGNMYEQSNASPDRTDARAGD